MVILNKSRNLFFYQLRRSTEHANENLERTIDPKNYSNGIAPQLLEGYEIVYYIEINNSFGSVTQFYWLHDGHYCFMKISQELLNEIQKNDPDALKGPLFQLQRVELE